MCHNNGGDRQYSCCVTPPVLVYDHLCSTIKSDSIQYMKTVKKEKKKIKTLTSFFVSLLLYQAEKNFIIVSVRHFKVRNYWVTPVQCVQL